LGSLSDPIGSGGLPVASASLCLCRGGRSGPDRARYPDRETQKHLRHALGGRVQLRAGIDPALQRVVDHEVECVEPWGIMAIDPRSAAIGAEMAIPFANRFGRKAGLKIGQVFGLARDHRNIEQMAFVTASRPGQVDKAGSSITFGQSWPDELRRRGPFANDRRTEMREHLLRHPVDGHRRNEQDACRSETGRCPSGA
jgi:hypothetical protein